MVACGRVTMMVFALKSVPISMVVGWPMSTVDFLRNLYRSSHLNEMEMHMNKSILQCRHILLNYCQFHEQREHNFFRQTKGEMNYNVMRDGWFTLRKTLFVIFFIALQYFVLDKLHNVGQRKCFLTQTTCQNILYCSRFHRLGICC